MISNALKTTSRVFWVLVLLAAFAPMRSLAADPTDLGKIAIEILNENGAKIGGDWYLHAGTTGNNLVVRNGTKGEEFDFPAGSYFLEVRNLKTHPFYKVFSVNPQSLEVGGVIKFKVQYFVTEDQKANAKDAPVLVAPAAPIVIPTPAPVPEVVAPAPVAPKKAPIQLTIVRPVTQDTAAEDNEIAANYGYSLATTGPSGLLGILSAFSLVSGLWITKRKNG